MICLMNIRSIMLFIVLLLLLGCNTPSEKVNSQNIQQNTATKSNLSQTLESIRVTTTQVYPGNNNRIYNNNLYNCPSETILQEAIDKQDFNVCLKIEDSCEIRKTFSGKYLGFLTSSTCMQVLEQQNPSKCATTEDINMETAISFEIFNEGQAPSPTGSSRGTVYTKYYIPEKKCIFYSEN